jgi:2-octaprenyl-6-methoxyphenol hydroxylase
MSIDADIAIVGGGLVGASLACALDGCGLDVVQLEAEAPRAGAAPRWDERHFALARRSAMVLDGIGVWAHARDAAQPIRHVHVSSRGEFGAVRVHASDHDLPALGWAVPARVVGEALARRVEACRSLRRLLPARVQAVDVADDRVSIRYDGPDGAGTVRARLLVAADGTDSTVRTLAGISAITHDYAQTAIVASVSPGKPHADWAYERFTDEGPFALLPLPAGDCGLIWTVRSDDAERVLGLDDAAFLAEARERFGSRLGRFRRVGRRQPWPLRLTRAAALAAPRTLLVGNAAQTIHPIGAQGFNLGLRDVMAVRDVVVAAARERGDPGAPARLAAYAAARAPDRDATIEWSDTLARGFARTAWPLRAGRGLAFAALDRLPWLKQDLAFTLMGYRGAGAEGSTPAAGSRP